jgi:hypothetical protein
VNDETQPSHVYHAGRDAALVAHTGLSALSLTVHYRMRGKKLALYNHPLNPPAQMPWECLDAPDEKTLKQLSLLVLTNCIYKVLLGRYLKIYWSNGLSEG